MWAMGSTSIVQGETVENKGSIENSELLTYYSTYTLDNYGTVKNNGWLHNHGSLGILENDGASLRNEEDYSIFGC